MGGFGSGRQSGGGQTTMEETRRIDVKLLKQWGYLRPGRIGRLSWNVGGEPNGYIHFQTFADHMRFKYKVREYGGEWESIEQNVWFERTSCNYGGHRTWFRCPGCNRRVGVLSGNGRLFLCRHCYDLPYGSQQETRIDRMIRARSKLESVIFDEESYRKAKGMHWATYNKLFERWANLESRVDTLISSKLTKYQRY